MILNVAKIRDLFALTNELYSRNSDIFLENSPNFDTDLSYPGIMDTNTEEQENSYATHFTLPVALVTGGIVVLAYTFWREAHNEAIRKKINVPGPRSWPFVGNLLDIRKFNGIHLLLCDYIQKYGKVFSLRLGSKLSVVVADPDIVKQILVKDFWNFRNHFGQPVIVAAMGKSVFFARDEAWKRIRTTLTPSFSAKKMKGMVSLIEESLDKLMEKVVKVTGTGKSRVHCHGNER